jgi:hypothetical protein
LKLRPLPATELANIAPLGVDQKWSRLRSFKSGFGPWSYDPVRGQTFNIANPTAPLAMRVTPPTWTQIEREIEKASNCGEQELACLEVARLFRDWLSDKVAFSIERKVPSMGIGSYGAVRYWENFAAVIDERPTFLFMDFRRAHGLTTLGRKFVFSMMHEQIRVADLDFPNAELGILQFPQEKGEERNLIDHFSDASIFAFDELSAMIDETYRIWEMVLAERRDRADGSKSAGGML